jgi:hypothetical protein
MLGGHLTGHGGQLSGHTPTLQGARHQQRRSVAVLDPLPAQSFALVRCLSRADIVTEASEKYSEGECNARGGV